MRWLVRILVSLLVLLGAIVIASVIWFWVSFPEVSYRYRLTIAVETDGQIHSGSSVIELKNRLNPQWARRLVGGSPGDSSVQGQAVLFDLGTRGALVAVLRGGPRAYCSVDARDLVGRAYEPAVKRRRCVPGYPTSIENERALSQKRGAVELTPDNLPAFIWFSDKSNLATAHYVEPANFASVIGDSARLVSVQVEITHDPIFIDIDKKLPAYAALRGPPINGNDYTAPDGSILGWQQFISPGGK